MASDEVDGVAITYSALRIVYLHGRKLSGKITRTPPPR
jgi:hypothetical protein